MINIQKKVKICLKININEPEQRIFDLFRNFVIEKKLNSTLRVAGGWVRDKLMGLESHDIDIAVDNMTGEEFIIQAKEYFASDTNVSGFGVTKLNPDKSKHLETAKIKIHDLWIDIVNLRGEIYENDSRIPQMKMGTPEEDAFRRDLTINSVFYNIMTNEIEDFTKMGIDDLERGIIRTPLDPRQTFLDDPLRILRTFRFAARYNFEISDQIKQSLQNQDIIEALRLKVTKERVGIELNQILFYQNAFICLKYYHEFKVWPVIFEVPDISPQLFLNNQLLTQKQNEGFELCSLINDYYYLIDQSIILNKYITKDQIKFFAFLSAAVAPFQEFSINKNKIANNLVSYIVREQLKVSNFSLKVFKQRS